MSKNRIVGLDNCKGFGILAMILIHAVIQQVAQYKGAIFVPYLQTMNILVLILFLPIAILSLMGTFFTLLACVNVTTQMITIKDKPKLLVKYLKGRLLTSFLIVLMAQIIWGILNAKFFENSKFFVPEFPIRFVADTLDAIAWSSAIVALSLYLILKFMKKINFMKLFSVILGFTILWFSLSPILINWSNNSIIPWLNEKELYLFEFILSKFSKGRFKLFHTLGFGGFGVIFGIFLHYKISIKKIVLFSCIGFVITLIIFIIALSIDFSQIVADFTSEDVPFPLQIFALGCEFFIYLFFMGNSDFGKKEKQRKFRKRTIFLRRYGIVSLTAFIIGTAFADKIYALFELIWGSSVGGTDQNPVLAWNGLLILFFIITVFVLWEILLRLWEKINYKFSVEWMISKITGKILNSKKSWINSAVILYKPCEIEMINTPNKFEEKETDEHSRN